MKTVYKYDIDADVTAIKMPKGSCILKVAYQDEQLRMWALVDTSKSPITRLFCIVGTGGTIPEDQNTYAAWVATVLTHNEQFVRHLFELNPWEIENIG